MNSIPQALPQFQHIKRYWDPRRKISVASILPGEIYVTKHHELITTVLGSCVAVCMRDKINKVGGMNHFKLPKPMDKYHIAENTNYGIYAMELLINEIMRAGGNKKFFECSVFGGGNVIKGSTIGIGEKNIAFVLEFLKKEGIRVIEQNTGHAVAQKVYFHSITGEVFSTEKQNQSLDAIRLAEDKYLKKINDEIDKSSIEYL